MTTLATRRLTDDGRLVSFRGGLIPKEHTTSGAWITRDGPKWLEWEMTLACRRMSQNLRSSKRRPLTR